MKSPISQIRNAVFAAMLLPAALPAASVIQFQTPNLEVKEGQEAKIVLTCTPPATNRIRVVVEQIGGTAQCPLDYGTPHNGTCGPLMVEFQTGSVTATASIGAVNDHHPEPDETLVLGIVEIGGGAVAGSITNLTPTITDANDELAVNVDLQFAPDFRRWPAITAVAVQPDGKILVAGQELFAGGHQVALVRLHAGGAVDASFRAQINADVYVSDIAFSSDGMIVLKGLSKDGNVFVTGLLTNGEKTQASGVMQPGTKSIEIGGFSYYYDGNHILRSDQNGVVDPSFSVRIDYFLPIVRLPNGGQPCGALCGWNEPPRLRIIPNGQSLLCWADSPFYANGVYQALVKIPVDSPSQGFIFERDLRGRVVAYESDGVVEIQISRTGSRSGAAAIRYRTGDGTARAGMDYTPAEGTLEFAPFEGVKSVRVALTQDLVFRGIKSFFVALSDPSIPASYERPVEVSIYDRELGLVLGSFLLRADGTAELEFDVTGLSFVGDYIVEGSRDLKQWSAVPGARFRAILATGGFAGAGLFSPASIGIALPSSPEFYRVRQR